jgi:NAD(P)H-flavin reductase
MSNPLAPRIAVINKITGETRDTKTFTFEFVDAGSKQFSFKAGQFVMISIFGYGEAAISIASDANATSGLELTVREVGDVTSALLRLQEGSRVGIRGPYGNGWPLEKAEGKNGLIVSGGCGCGTLRPIILAQKNDPERFRFLEVLHGARTPQDIIYRNDYEDKWTKTPNTRILLSADTVPKGEKWRHTEGVVTTLFEKMKTGPDESFAFVCGPEIMIKFAALGLLRLGFQEDQIYCSMERQMRCGLGICGHCQLGSKYVCKDGPVFSYAELKHLPDHIVGGG